MASVSAKVLTITFEGPFQGLPCAVSSDDRFTHGAILTLNLPLTDIEPEGEYTKPLGGIPYSWACRVDQLPEALTVTSLGVGKVAITARLHVQRDLHDGMRSDTKLNDWVSAVEHSAMHVFKPDFSNRTIRIRNCKGLEILEP